MRLQTFDLDGVITDDTHRIDDALAGNWAEYYRPERVLADPPISEGVRQAKDAAYFGNSHVAYLSGRRDSALRAATAEWLWRHRLPVGDLRMRADDETMPLGQFKASILIGWLGKGYDEIIHMDDDPSVIATINALGVPHIRAIQCPWRTKDAALIGIRERGAS